MYLQRAALSRVQLEPNRHNANSIQRARNAFAYIYENAIKLIQVDCIGSRGESFEIIHLNVQLISIYALRD